MHKFTSVILESADAASVARYQPDGATVSAQLLLEVIDRPENEIVIRQALEDEASNPERIDEKYPYAGVADRVAVGIGAKLLDTAPGARTLMAVCDPRLAHDTEALIDCSRRIVGLHAARGRHSCVTVALPATWQGLRAAEQLSREGIPTNVEHVFSIAQAAAAVDAKPAMITAAMHLPAAATQVDGGPPTDADHAAAVATAQSAFSYVKRHRGSASTQVVVGGLRSSEDALAVAGADGVRLSPHLLHKVIRAEGSQAHGSQLPVLHEFCSEEVLPGITEAAFHEMLAATPGATEKLEASLAAAERSQNALEARLWEKATKWGLPVLPDRQLVCAD